MGDRRRISPEGPRFMEDADYRSDEMPKVVQNPQNQQVIAKAHCEPLVPIEQSTELLALLDSRGESQRGKPRSRDPLRNPLGGRIFDMACSWPMYRVPRKDSFRYSCGHYQQSHGESCEHNQIEGPAITKFALAAIRQRLFNGNWRDRLEAKLRSKSTLDKTCRRELNRLSLASKQN
jgi:hypothetical protein